ncbi:FAD synthase-like isoform X2 [Lineus longissimus]|uniref:FAD synthase-like isoform X2 n=1 Tax=Lineus longissimus TaxID=88925 RepID=UPI00315D536E
MSIFGLIGDEILKGQVRDTNSHFFCKRLFAIGVKVERISVISDDLDTIAEEVAKFSKKYTHVITSGGIGPTHDDKTVEGVAKAFNEPLHLHPELAELCKKYFHSDNGAYMKFANVPESAKLQYGTDKKTGRKNYFPLISVNNVYIFPGVPSILERVFLTLEDLFRNPDIEYHTASIYVQKDEVSITPILNKFVDKYKNSIVLGSYPDFHNSYYKVKLNLEALKKEVLDKAEEELKSMLPQGTVVNFDEDPFLHAAEQVYKMVESDEDTALHRSVKQAMAIIEEALKKYSVSELCVSFNGGKDCTVILHLVYAALKKHYPDDTLQAMYVQCRMPFPEVESFIQNSKQSYNLELIELSGKIKDCLGRLKQDQPHIKAMFMGTRNTDPYSGHLGHFAKTDSDWPEYMRISPILDWDYSELWAFLRKLNLPYCGLYDRGYTSLGSMDNTHPNPKLQYTDDKGILRYQPAYLLGDAKLERDGRN